MQRLAYISIRMRVLLTRRDCVEIPATCKLTRKLRQERHVVCNQSQGCSIEREQQLQHMMTDDANLSVSDITTGNFEKHSQVVAFVEREDVGTDLLSPEERYGMRQKLLMWLLLATGRPHMHSRRLRSSETCLATTRFGGPAP
jgi:hypothetical protein